MPQRLFSIRARAVFMAVTGAPLASTATAVATVIVALVGGLTVARGHLPSDGPPGLICVLVLIAVSACEISRAARTDRRRRRTGRRTGATMVRSLSR